MAGRPPDVTEAELAVLRSLWEHGPSTVRQLIDRLYPPGGPSAHATVQKLLERLEAKGAVARDRGGPVQVFAATVGREELIDRRLGALADDLCGGSLASLLSHLVRVRRLPEGERRKLRELLDRLAPPDEAGEPEG